MDTPNATPSPAPMPAGAASLGTLLSETVSYCKAHWQALALGAVVFGVAMGVVGASVAAKVGHSAMQGMDGMGFDTNRMQELTDRMEQGDTAAMDELEQMLKGMDTTRMDDAMRGPIAGAVRSALPAVGFAVIANWILGMLAYAYYVMVAIEGTSANAAASRSAKVLPSLFLLNVWSFIRSFVWIPILGLIPAVILTPRFVAAPIILLAEGKGVNASVSDSYRRTRGYWGKIVGNGFAASIVAFVTVGVITTVLSMLLVSAPTAAIVVKQILAQGASAFAAVFAIRLAHTILQHPRA